jgi:hypothetical protein
LLAPCCLYFQKIGTQRIASLSTWNQYKWMAMHHTSLNLLFPLSTPSFEVVFASFSKLHSCLKL